MRTTYETGGPFVVGNRVECNLCFMCLPIGHIFNKSDKSPRRPQNHNLSSHLSSIMKFVALISALLAVAVSAQDQEPSPSLSNVDNFAPSVAPSVDDGSIVSDFPSLVPSITPSGGSGAQECSANAQCNALNLEGLCCPTLSGLSLECCDGGPEFTTEQQCEQNPQCASRGLTGACCPTSDGANSAYLDCCASLPNECVDASSCVVTSTEQFILAMKKESSSSAALGMTSAGAALAWMVAAVL